MTRRKYRPLIQESVRLLRKHGLSQCRELGFIILHLVFFQKPVDGDRTRIPESPSLQETFYIVNIFFILVADPMRKKTFWKQKVI
jgi:hypothetical protein